MSIVKQLAAVLRKGWDAEDLAELREELRPAYEEVTVKRGIEFVEFRCRGAEEHDQLVAYLRQRKQDTLTHYASVGGREFFVVRPRQAIGLAIARDFVKGFK